MRWRPNASAAARASPRCWRRCDGRHQTEIRRSPSSAPASWARASPPMSPMPACRWCCSTSSAKDNANRNAIAEGAVEKLLKTDPAPFMSRAAAQIRHDRQYRGRSSALADCDWIIEAVIERLDVKQALYAKIEAARKAGQRRLVQHLDDPAWPARRGPAGALRAGFHHHPFLQSAALHAASGNRRRAEDRVRRPSRAYRASPI